MGWPWSMSRRLRPGISRRRESRPSWCKIMAWMSPSRQHFRIRCSFPHPYSRRLVYRPTWRRTKNLCRRVGGINQVSARCVAGSLRAVFDRGPGCHAAGARRSGLLPDVRQGHVSRGCRTAVGQLFQSLAPRSARPCVEIRRTDRERFHGMAFRCCAGVSTLGDVNLSSPRPKSWRLRVTKCSTPPAIANFRT